MARESIVSLLGVKQLKSILGLALAFGVTASVAHGATKLGDEQSSLTLTLPSGLSSIADNYVFQDNLLSQVLPDVADGTQVLTWNPANQTFESALFVLGGWLEDATLRPGQGAFIFSPIEQTVTFTGQTGPAPSEPRLATGRYLVGCRTPAAADFENLMGFPPQVGDRVCKYDAVSQDLPIPPSGTYEFTGLGWSPSAPVLDPGKAAFVELVDTGPPDITMQPQSRTNLVGTTATFTVVVGGSAPFGFQWRKNDTPLSDGTRVSGATAAILILTDVQLTDTGDYAVMISNLSGVVTSQVAQLTVESGTPPQIVEQPQSVTNFQGSAATFAVSVDGTPPFSFQWRKGSTALMDGGSVSGADGPMLVLADVQPADAGGYAVAISNAFGSVTSSVATVTVVPFEAYEGFDYAVGPLGGQNGGNGFNGQWLCGFTAVDGSLTYPGLAYSGRRVQGLGNIGDCYRNLAATIGAPGTTVYLSFLVRPESYSDSGYFGVILNGRLIGKPGTTNRYVIEGNPHAVSEATVVVGQTALLVVKCESGSRFTLYANPMPGLEPMTGAVSVSDFPLRRSELGFYSLGQIVSFDEIRFGSSFADVTPLRGPSLTGVQIESDMVRFRFNTVVGLRYLVERRLQLADEPWTDVGIWPGTGVPVQFSEGVTQPSAFYRVRVELDE